MIADPQQLERLQTVTREYSRFSRSAGGFGYVIAGVLSIVMYWMANSLDSKSWPRLLLASIPIIWIFSKEWLRRHYYQKFGFATEIDTEESEKFRQRNLHISLATAFFVVFFIISSAFWGMKSLDTFGFLELVLFIALPILMWFYGRSYFEAVILFNLMTQASRFLEVSSSSNPIFELLFPILFIAVGLQEHLQFKRLETQLQSLRDQP
jgi:hypothetical protein